MTMLILLVPLLVAILLVGDELHEANHRVESALADVDRDDPDALAKRWKEVQR